MEASYTLIRFQAGGDAAEGLLDMEGLARAAALHPELVRRLYCLGLFDEAARRQGEPLFDASAALRLRRMARLRRDLCLSWAALGLVMDLLERVDDLEARVRAMQGQTP